MGRFCLLLALFVAVSAACRRSSVPSAEDAQQAGRSSAPPPAGSAATPPTASVQPQYSYIHTGDVRTRPQLLSGWYAIEDGSFRWMGKEARATLLPLSGDPVNFELKLFFPEGHMKRSGGAVKVSVLMDGEPFAEQTYRRPGGFTLTQAATKNFPPGKFPLVTIRLDRAIPPGDADKRELGVVVQSFGFVK